MIVTEYHKSEAMTDQSKVIPPFLCGGVSKLLVLYLSDVLPLVRAIRARAQ